MTVLACMWTNPIGFQFCDVEEQKLMTVLLPRPFPEGSRFAFYHFGLTMYCSNEKLTTLRWERRRKNRFWFFMGTSQVQNITSFPVRRPRFRWKVWSQNGTFSVLVVTSTFNKESEKISTMLAPLLPPIGERLIREKVTCCWTLDKKGYRASRLQYQAGMTQD